MFVAAAAIFLIRRNIMLYKKNREPHLDDALFASPTSEYRGAPFWSWNCELDRDELLRQIDCLHKMGFGGFHMHSRTGMATPYLSTEFLDLIDACVERARELGMYAWLYDEDRWPSGSCGGKVTREHPELRQRTLTAETHAPDHALDENDAVASGAPYMIACFDVIQNERGEMIRYERVTPDSPVTPGAARWYFNSYAQGDSEWYNNSAYIDTLNPDAADEFIRLTYDTFRDRFGKDFGGIIPAIFTDEPQFASKRSLSHSIGDGKAVFPWTPSFPSFFRDKYGYDLIERLPELILELPCGAVSQARYHFHDCAAEMFTRGFNDRCGVWCEKNGIKFTGHLMEEPTLESQTHAVGDAQRSYRNMQLPGIDMLCNRVELTTAKQAQSAVHQYGREGMTSELYGVTNWDFDFRGHKFQGDWQSALGVTVRVHHLSWVSMEGDAKRDYPATINYQSPWYDKYGYVEDHFARVNTALTRGKPLVRVGVIHPVESYWLRFGPSDLTSQYKSQLEENFSNITRWLLTGTIDFDFICESTLPAQYKKTPEGLTVGEMTYDAVIVPAPETLRRTTLDILTEFADAGGRLIFAGDAPLYVDAVPSDEPKKLYDRCRHVQFSRTSVLSALSDVRTVSISDRDGTATNDLIYQMRRDMDCDWLFIAHITEPPCIDVSHPRHITVSLAEEYSPVLYDTLTGEIKSINYHTVNGKTNIDCVLYAHDSLLLRLDRCLDNNAVETKDDTPQYRELTHELDFRRPVSYMLSEPNVLLLDTARFAADDEELSEDEEEILRADNICRRALGIGRRNPRPAQPWTIKKKPPEHRIRLQFTFDSEIEYDGALLAIEHPELAVIVCNGTNVDTTPIGYFTDRAIKTIPLPTLHRGENVINVTLPLGERTATEWCYVLGDFGVRVRGCRKCMIPPEEKLGFGTVTGQGLPFYSGNITYELPFTSPGGECVVRTGTYRGAAVTVSIDGGDEHIVAYEPYKINLGVVSPGEHKLHVKLLGTRHNSFAALHATDYGNDWYGPDKWRTVGEGWCYEYKYRDMGILTSPVIQFFGKKK